MRVKVFSPVLFIRFIYNFNNRVIDARAIELIQVASAAAQEVSSVSAEQASGVY